MTLLLPADRCDRCGAQAYVLTTLITGSELCFCAHHWREHGDAIRPSCVHVHDETATLTSSHSG